VVAKTRRIAVYLPPLPEIDPRPASAAFRKQALGDGGLSDEADQSFAPCGNFAISPQAARFKNRGPEIATAPAAGLYAAPGSIECAGSWLASSGHRGALPHESFDVGSDLRTAVNPNDYKVPFAFTGVIERVTVALAPSQLMP
jgi:hypothetical protein